MGPAAPAKTGRQGEEPLAGSTQCVLSYIGARGSTLPTALWEDTRGSCLGVSWVCPKPVPWLMLIHAPCLPLTGTVRTEP